MMASAIALTMVAAPQSAQAASLTPLFHFDQHVTISGVVQGTGANAGFLYGSIYETSQTSGGALFRVPVSGGAPATIYQLKSTDGYSLRATLLASTDGYLYGTTHNSGRTATKITAGGGTVFRIAQDGSGYTTIYDFGGATPSPISDDSVVPDFPLIEGGGYLYGVTQFGGDNGSGMVYRVRKSDGAFTKLHSFPLGNSDGTTTTGEGFSPSAGLTLGSDGRLYGVTQYGGANLVTSSSQTYGTGTIYSLNVDGTGFQTLYSFPALDTTVSPAVNTVGVTPRSALIEPSPGVWVGTTDTGGTPTDPTLSGLGTVFRFNVATHTATALYTFDGTLGTEPGEQLAYSVTTGQVYGATASSNFYSVDPVSGTFSELYAFTGPDGAGIVGGITLGSDGDLYGATSAGGACTDILSSGYGTVFRYSLTTNASYNTYSSCTPLPTSSSGGGGVNGGWLLLLGLLGLAPPVRRRMFGLQS